MSHKYWLAVTTTSCCDAIQMLCPYTLIVSPQACMLMWLTTKLVQL